MDPNGARDEFHLPAAAKNLRKLAKLIPMPLEPAPAWIAQSLRLQPS